MSFTLSNVISPELSKSPLNDMISNAFGGYEQAVKAKYLQPNMSEALKKAQLYNQYYGPNIQSQIGLRGAQAGQANAQAGLLGSQTRGSDIQNRYLKDKLVEEIINARQYNEYYPRDIESQIGLRGAQSGQANAQAGLLGSQTRGSDIQNRYLPYKLVEEIIKDRQYNQYYPRDIESQIGLRGAQSGQANAQAGLLGSQTRRSDIENKNLPDKLRADLYKTILGNLYYGQNQDSQMALNAAQAKQANANAGLIGEHTKGAGIENQYLPAKLRATNKKADLEAEAQNLQNKYYGNDINSQIALRTAQEKQTNASAGLIGEQTRGAGIENKYLPQKMQATISELDAKANKANLLQNIRQKMMGSGQNPQNAQGPAMNGQGMFSSGFQAGEPNAQGGMQYAQAATAMQALGLGKPKIVEANGKYIAITPFGNIDTGVNALTEKQKELQKQDAKRIGKLEDDVIKTQSMSDNLNGLNEVLVDKEFTDLRKNALLGKHELNWYEKYGSKKQQFLVANAKTYMKNIIKASAKDFSGQFRVGEQALLNEMKPNESDTIPGMRGKAAALTFLNTILQKRSESEANYMRNYGMSPLEAKMATDREIDPKKIRQDIYEQLHPETNAVPSADEARAELDRRKASRRNNG